MYILLILIAIIILLILLYIPWVFQKYDHYYPISYESPKIYNKEIYNPNFLLFGPPYVTTRNMSYDLRGDVQIPYFMNLPFNMTSRIPIKNRPLDFIS
jgi:hypothetical protein